ncbi:MAG: hypothetical protein QOH89_371, partial [Pseudonocardiales bacterium]|nr:hypothetical protein [Pseudonocardiales bacterium]
TSSVVNDAAGETSGGKDTTFLRFIRF